MIKNIVFDFGNVIGKFDPDYICGFYCDKENLETFKDIIFDKWADLDAGYIEYDDFKNKKIDRLPDNLKEAGENFFKDLILCKKGQAFPVLFQAGHLYTVVTRLVQGKANPLRNS